MYFVSDPNGHTRVATDFEQNVACCCEEFVSKISRNCSHIPESLGHALDMWQKCVG